MTSFAVMLLALTAPAADPKEPVKTPPAKVVVTAELACMHCTFGEGDGCAACLKIDDKTPVLLSGKIGKEFIDERLAKKVVVVEGALGLKDKRMDLKADSIRYVGDKEKDKGIPEKGLARIVGAPACAKCDLNIGKECLLAIINPGTPIVLDGKLASKCAEDFEAKTLTFTGRLFIDKNGLVRLDASKIDGEKKK